MFKLVPLTMQHLLPLTLEPMNIECKDWAMDGTAEEVLTNSVCFAGIVKGEVVVAFGAVPLWSRRGYLWTLFSEKIKYCSLPAYKGLRRFLREQNQFDRLEMDTPTDVELIHRRARFLGFKLECAVARKYSPRGEDKSLYAWVRE